MKSSKLKNKKEGYTITKLDGSSRKAMLCPDCGEKLVQEDVEQYSTCPYCGKKLILTNEMEDFILLPFADPWDISGGRIVPESFSHENDKKK